MWALFNWTHQGSLLGSAKTFAMEYDGPISRVGGINHTLYKDLNILDMCNDFYCLCNTPQVFYQSY